MMESFNTSPESPVARQHLEQLPPKVRVRLQRILENDEQLLWAEWTGIKTPADLWYWLKSCEPSFVKSTFWVSLVLLGLFGIGWAAKIEFLFTGGGFLLICMLGLMLWMWLAAREAGYALTDRRAIMFSPSVAKSYNHIKPAEIKIVQYAPDLTRLYLGQRTYKDEDGDERTENFEITTHSDALQLRRLIEEYFTSQVDPNYGWPEIPLK